MAVGEFSQVIANNSGVYVYFQPTGTNVFLCLSAGCTLEMEIEIYDTVSTSHSYLVYRGASTKDVKINAMFGKLPIDNTQYLAILGYTGIQNVGMVQIA